MTNKSKGNQLPKIEELLSNPTSPVEIDAEASVGDLVKAMSGVSFQGRSLATAMRIWGQMLEKDAYVFFGLAGAMIPAGMRKVVGYLIENQMIDCLVSTGANLFHDCHETLGRRHWKGSPAADDVVLKECGVDRIYDTFASDEEFRATDKAIADFAGTLDHSRAYTTREFLYGLGGYLEQRKTEDGVLTTAYRANLPIYCPAFADSSLAIALAVFDRDETLKFDIVGDVIEMAELATGCDTSGVIFVGGGTPKNFIQQSEVTTETINRDIEGHRYAIQITTDSPQWGGLSGCTFDEAQSWGKIADEAARVTVHADATIVLPILVTAVAKNFSEQIARRSKRPREEMEF
jgi:deoxyhypusine synthase